MLWWLIGLWLLSPTILPILWLLGMRAASNRSELNEPTGETPGPITAFAESAQPALLTGLRPSSIPDRPHPAPINVGSR
jgi:hypothetical protein